MKNIKSNANGSKTDIGAWFVTYNTEKMWASNFGSGNPIRYRTLMPDGSYGILLSDNAEHIDFQLSKMAEAKMDFILFDNTNGGLTPKIPYGYTDRLDRGNRWIVDNSYFVCQRIAEWNKTHEWKIKYAHAVGCYQQIRGFRYDSFANCINKGMSIGEAIEWQAEAVYKRFYEDPVIGGDNYYQLDGKPLLVAHDWGENLLTVPHGWNNYKGDRTYGDKFTVRNGQMGEKGTYGWQTRYGTQVDEEVEVVCPGHSTHGGKYHGIYRNKGKYYKREWETVINNPSPRIVMIASLNDYNEDCGIFPADTSQCIDSYEEQWRDENGNLNPNLYWDMTVDYIKKLRVKNGDKF